MGKRKASLLGWLVLHGLNLLGAFLHIVTIMYPKTKMKAVRATTGAKITVVATIVSIVCFLGLFVDGSIVA